MSKKITIKRDKVYYDNIHIRVDKDDECINIAATSDIKLSDVDKFIYAVKLAATLAANEIKVEFE